MSEGSSTVAKPVALSLHSATQGFDAAKASAFGLALAAAGMALQIAGGSTLYPSPAGPIVLLVTALIVVLRPSRWTPYLALVVPLVLGIGAIVAALMSAVFIAQLSDTGRIGVLLGSLMHVAGLVVAVAAGAWMVIRSRRASPHER